MKKTSKIYSNDLISQENKLLNFAKNNNYQNIISITDLGSGLNYKKPGLKKLLHLIFYFCDLFKVSVIIVENIADKSFEI